MARIPDYPSKSPMDDNDLFIIEDTNAGSTANVSRETVFTTPGIENANIGTITEFATGEGTTVEGVNFQNSEITTPDSVTQSALADSALPQYDMFTISSSTFGSTGDKTISHSLGRVPKLIRFIGQYPSSSNVSGFAQGEVLVATGDEYVASHTGSGRNSTINSCVGWTIEGSSSWAMQATFVSADENEFVINVTNSSSGLGFRCIVEG